MFTFNLLLTKPFTLYLTKLPAGSSAPIRMIAVERELFVPVTVPLGI
jgi:hypothetical protein